MKLLLQNKKIVIVISAVVFLSILGVGTTILRNQDSKKVGKQDSDTGIEAELDENKEDAENVMEADNTDSADTKKESAGLEILEDANGITKDSVDASGSWDDTTENDEHANGAEDVVETEESEEDILEDEIIWGDIY